ncbi:holin [Rhodococcus rhodochrous]|uniref:holin n=1 Tax=Rhodococcus rhodochrous TaxID=1829 RepID=UPI001E4861E6|nr:holin [Rhodococcus rhodochrous]MCB8914031.1 holin [Rhodococcus rhodochrous]
MDRSVYTAQFWKDAGERAVATFLQTIVALIGAGEVFSIGWLGWKEIFTTALGTAALSVVKSVIAGVVGVKGTASLTAAVEPVPRSSVDRLLSAYPGVRDLVRKEIAARIPVGETVLDTQDQRVSPSVQARVREPERRNPLAIPPITSR